MDKRTFERWVEEALARHGGRATILEVAKHIWQNHEQQLRGSGDRFYSWQYDMRWAATALRKAGRMKPADASPDGLWELAT